MDGYVSHPKSDRTNRTARDRSYVCFRSQRKHNLSTLVRLPSVSFQRSTTSVSWAPGDSCSASSIGHVHLVHCTWVVLPPSWSAGKRSTGARNIFFLPVWPITIRYQSWKCRHHSDKYEVVVMVTTVDRYRYYPIQGKANIGGGMDCTRFAGACGIA